MDIYKICFSLHCFWIYTQILYKRERTPNCGSIFIIISQIFKEYMLLANLPTSDMIPPSYFLFDYDNKSIKEKQFTNTDNYITKVKDKTMFVWNFHFHLPLNLSTVK